MRPLPPLNSLRAFEAAGRHLSFTRAAAELNVTPAAVSQQIKHLEEYFGVTLFRRVTRALLLTDAGRRLLPGTSDGLNKLSDAVRSTRLLNETNILTVSVSPSFGAKWLVPRLETFRQVHPKFDVRVDATDRLVNFERESVDVAVRYGSGGYPGVDSEALLANYLFPVCSPELISGPHAIRTPQASLVSRPSVDLDSRPKQWVFRRPWKVKEYCSPRRLWSPMTSPREILFDLLVQCKRQSISRISWFTRESEPMIHIFKHSAHGLEMNSPR